ncbi:2,3-diketo-5-methylthio-1-phosphopentane phosphatase [Acidihalobacter yilgarnensis]|uniref:Enolase-phosphatase E1 n=1 Tax=Acidihalobacter yilgarnensis TaxID=2819280 RepID=A0A1D8IR04_9GAMM|nr:acireductone synthase [Acidihalobacter yilgarnensis]AOU98921.1 2,3-diketo-5-methylthio-1-phosphopentane phosphatase [Acidihalobacter yilgarnensis]
MIRAILTDIEGTTSSLAFVKDTLFPYAAQAMPAFVRQHENDPEVAALLKAIAKEADAQDTPSIIDTLLGWIQEDRKATPLKTLQGLIWADGYTRGQLRGHVYADAARQLRAWHTAGLQIYIYSSGSVQAQQLLFAHTAFGNLTNLFTGYFDTRIGGKRETASYRGIAAALTLPPGEILFLSDVCAELDAAREAGMKTHQLLREGVNPQPCGHPQSTDFDQVARDQADLPIGDVPAL